MCETRYAAAVSPRQRRRSGTGGISQRHDDPDCPPVVNGIRPPHVCHGRWAAVYELPPVDGKRRRRVLYARTKRDALAKLKVALSNQQSTDL